MHGVPHLAGVRFFARSNIINTAAEDRVVHHSSHAIDANASTHDLLNNATEWLQYSLGLTELLAELIHESDSVDCQRMALGLEAIGALTRMGMQCAAHAHTRISWERARHARDGTNP